MVNTIADKREAILKTALTLFTERGFHNTPTSLIAKEAGVATGTLFHYFKNKEILINDLYLHIKKEMLDMLKGESTKISAIEDKLEFVWMNAVKWGIMHPKESLFFQQFASSPFISNLTREQAASQFEFIFDLIDEAIKTNKLKPMSKEFISTYFEGMVFTTIQYLRKYPEFISEENLLRIFDVYKNGIALK